MKKLLLLLLFIPTVLFSRTAPENKVIAKVDSFKITQGDFDYELSRLTKAMVPADYVMSEEEELTFKTQIIENLIMKHVYTQKLDDLKVEIDPSIIDEQFAQLTAQYGSEEAMIKDIEEKGFTFDELKEEFTYQFRLQELSKIASESDVEISDMDVQAYYDVNKDTVFAMPPTATARHILIQPENGDTTKALADIKAIRDEIINGLDFAEAAIKYSQGPSGPDGGQLGQFQKGQMVQEFEMVAFAIPLNQVSEPVLTQFGYHLILVENRTEVSYAPFQDTVEYITSKLKVEKYFKDIESSVKITRPDWVKSEA